MRRRHQYFQLIGHSHVVVTRAPGRELAQYIASTNDNRERAAGLTPEAAVTSLFRRLAVQHDAGI